MNLHPELWDVFLYVTVDGEIDFDSCVRMIEQLVDIAERRRISKILLDARYLTGSLSARERLELATKGTAYLLPLETKLRTAVVGYSPTFRGLGVLAAQKLGVDVRLFPSIQEAVEWLSKSSNLRR